ncbi:MAG TPA: zinc-binding dehydrogenase [Humisphaera sp.]|jgi:NADPH2:quinone reductase|nr:zinc-binding dehydrogenase [Humisphaera sp.]
MKAWLLNQIGDGIDGLRLSEVPDPKPAENEVVLKVRYAAINPADRYLAEGQYPAKPPVPHVLGRDGFGEVIAIGPGVKGIAIGDRRTILRGETGVSRAGTLAQFVTVAATELVEPPAGWNEQQSAAAALVYLTAYQALTQWGDLPPGVVLITGASGGVGVAGTQLAAAMGHTVVGLSRSAEKGQRLKELGARAVFDPQDQNWRQALKEFLGGGRVDLIIDNIGGELFSQVIDTLGMWGKVSVVGRLAGPVPQFNTASLFFRRARIGGVAVGSYSNAESRAAWEAACALLEQTGAKPLIDSVFPFDQVPRAFAQLAKGPMGKVVVEVNA